MKNIWLINPYGPIEGEKWREYSFNQFGKFLSQNGYNVIWWTATFSHHFKAQRSSGWKDIRVNKHFIIRLVPTTSYKKNMGIGRLIKDIVFGISCSRGLKKCHKPDLIISAENPLTMGVPSYKFAVKNKIPMIYDQMDIWPEFIISSLNPKFRKLATILFKPVVAKRKKIYDNLDGAIALGKHYLEFMFSVSPSLSNKPNALVYNGIDVEVFRSYLNNSNNIAKLPIKQNGDIWCVFAGTLGPSYDIPAILDCAKKMDELNLGCFKFIIAGSGPYENIVKEHEKSLDNIVYLGKLLPEELIPIYGKCDIGLSTYTEGSNVDMPDKLYDYTSAGLVVINSLKGEISEHILEKNIGKNYIAGNSDSLFEAIIKYKDSKILEETKSNSYKIASVFDKNVQNDKLLYVIEQII